jgi:hypothetical protein
MEADITSLPNRLVGQSGNLPFCAPARNTSRKNMIHFPGSLPEFLQSTAQPSFVAALLAHGPGQAIGLVASVDMTSDLQGS